MKKQTPCEKLGYKIGDTFRVIVEAPFRLNEIIELLEDDGSDNPLFVNLYREKWFTPLNNIKKMEKVTEEIQHPSHYNNGEIECIVAIKASMTSSEFQGYLKGNAIKYLWRMGLKGKPLVDVQKAQWYVDKLRGEMEKE